MNLALAAQWWLHTLATPDVCGGAWQLPQGQLGRREPWVVTLQSEVLHGMCGGDDGGEVRFEYGGGGVRAALGHYEEHSIVVRS